MKLIKELETYFVNSKVLGLAVAIVFGGVFSDLVKTFVHSIFHPLLLQQQLDITEFMSTVVNFILTIVIMFYLIIKPLNTRIKANDKENKNEEQNEIRNIISDVFDKKFISHPTQIL